MPGDSEHADRHHDEGECATCELLLSLVGTTGTPVLVPAFHALVAVTDDASPAPAPGACGEEQVRDFCKNAYHLRALRFSAVRDETDPARVNRDALEAAAAGAPTGGGQADAHLLARGSRRGSGRAQSPQAERV